MDQDAAPPEIDLSSVHSLLSSIVEAVASGPFFLHFVVLVLTLLLWKKKKISSESGDTG